MKKMMVAVLLALGLSACSGDATNHMKCRESVVKDVGTTEVVEVQPYKFIARDAGGGIWYYETMAGSGPQVTTKNTVFNGK